MIIVRLMGGLGNQMFQYAAGRRLAEYRGTNLKLDLSWLNTYQKLENVAKRQYDLDCFVLKADFATKQDIARVNTPPNTLRRVVYRKLAGPITLLREPEKADFQPHVLTAKNNTYLEGYWQSDKYFSDQADIIRKDLSFKNPPSSKYSEIMALIENGTTVSLHVRRGDYVKEKLASEILGALPLSYYESAMKYIASKVANPVFIVFSDDINWCKKNLKAKYKIVFADVGGKSWEDLQVMSLCNHHIIANSSFSWWGGWLNPSQEKIVVAPKNWFKEKSMNSVRLFPEEWVKL